MRMYVGSTVLVKNIISTNTDPCEFYLRPFSSLTSYLSTPFLFLSSLGNFHPFCNFYPQSSIFSFPQHFLMWNYLVPFLCPEIFSAPICLLLLLYISDTLEYNYIRFVNKIYPVRAKLTNLLSSNFWLIYSLFSLSSHTAWTWHLLEKFANSSEALVCFCSYIVGLPIPFPNVQGPLQSWSNNF